MRGNLVLHLLLALIVVVTLEIDNSFAKRGLKIFNIVKFPNTACKGDGSKNGTCYTSDECSNKKGVASGSCADGYGVCCIITLDCGGTSVENCTYLTQTSTTSPTKKFCTYSLCKSDPSVCRIRLDFMTFEIAGPVVGTVQTVATDTDVFSNSIGHCVQDTFFVSSSGNVGSPVICGYNTGQHMIVDATDDCAQATFSFGGDTFDRKYDIKVTHYECGSERGGPQECLQYYTGISGKFASYNFPTNKNVIDASVTHLANQRYTACFRRASGYCAICFFPTIVAAPGNAAIQSSYGLGISNDDAVGKSINFGSCNADYIIIPYATSDIPGATASNVFPATDGPRACGRILAAVDGVVDYTGNPSVCTSSRPFRVHVVFDAVEMTMAGITLQKSSEEAGAPGGIIGFSLNFEQKKCTA